jgi:lipopolysaccharide transport system permease protein
MSSVYKVEANEKGSLREDIRQFLQWRELFFILIQKNISLSYRQTYIGFFWVIIQPLLMAVILKFVLERFNQNGVEGIPYFLFLFLGYGFWNIATKGISNGSNAIVLNTNLVAKVFFPRAILPASYAVSVWVDLVLVQLMFFIFVVSYGFPLIFKMLLIPLPILLMMIFIFGSSLWIAALSVHFRDAQIFLPFALQMGQFLSPILYPLSAIPEKIKLFYCLNPFVFIIEISRWMMFEAYPLIELKFALIGLVSLVAITYWGLLFFKKMTANVSDFL